MVTSIEVAVVECTPGRLRPPVRALHRRQTHSHGAERIVIFFEYAEPRRSHHPPCLSFTHPKPASYELFFPKVPDPRAIPQSDHRTQNLAPAAPHQV